MYIASNKSVTIYYNEHNFILMHYIPYIIYIHFLVTDFIPVKADKK